MMSDSKAPRLRTVSRVKPPYPLNQFPADFGIKVGKHVIYALATKNTPDIAGAEWEQIFAESIGATWQPSNVGLADVVLGTMAWSAKSIKTANPASQKTVRLISGRNSPAYSFDQKNLDIDPQLIGEQVLQIWNERVNAVRARFADLRTVVLLKSRDLTRLAIFEFETTFYPPEQYFWQENEEGNLEGLERTTRFHKFTWQPHGSQFTIIEPVPEDCLLITLKQPPKLEKDEVLKAIRFDESWISVRRKNQESA